MLDIYNSKDKPIPKLPIVLVWLALSFIPLVYIISIIVAIIPISLWLILLIKINFHLPLIVIVIGIGALTITYACFKGIWISLFRKKGACCAYEINLDHEPKLKKLIEKICNELHTNFPNAIIINAEPSFFVLEGKLKLINNEVEGKVLSIGLPLLNSLSVDELHAILVHEFAHFTGKDTLYSSHVFPIYSSLKTSIKLLKDKMKNDWENDGEFLSTLMYILPVSILNFALKSFQLVDMKISRSREKRADYIATIICGRESYSNALKKITRLIGSFYELSTEQILELLKVDKVFINYYDNFRKKITEDWDFSQKFEDKAMSEKNNFFNSHPTLKKRLKYLPNVPNSNNDNAPVQSLLFNLTKYEEDLTSKYSEYLSVIYREEIKRRKIRYENTKNHGPIVRARIVRCSHCRQKTYADITHCDMCGKRL